MCHFNHYPNYDLISVLSSFIKVCALLFIPTVFDLFGTALAKIGLLYCTVSVYQLVRCTVIIITAILKAFVLKDHLEPYMWAGVFINLFAMCLISAVTFFDKDNKSGKALKNCCRKSFS